MPTSKSKSTQRPRTAASVAERKLHADAFDLDALTREVEHSPFVTKIGGEYFTFDDPTEADWRDARNVDPSDLDMMMRALLGDQYEAFEKHPLPVWKVAALANKIQEHYGLMGGQGEEPASPTS